MQLTSNTAISAQINNAYTTYNSNTGLWNISQNHLNLYLYVYFSRPLAVYFQKNSGGALPSGANENSVYYFFQIRTSNSVHVGFAENCNDAVKKVPMKFPSSGDEFTFVSTGRTYRLRSLYKHCCDEQLFDTQLPDSSPLGIMFRMPLPDKLPKKITVTISGVAKHPDFSNTLSARLIPLAALINGEWDLYHGATNPHPQSYFSGVGYYFGQESLLPAQTSGEVFAKYQNIKTLPDGGLGQTYCFLKLTMRITGTSFTGFNVLYEIHLEAKTLVGPALLFGGLFNFVYSGSIGLPSDGQNISDSIFSSIPTLTLTEGYVIGLEGFPQTLTAISSGNYASELSPPTLTLTRSMQPPPLDSKLTDYSQDYPLRDWTTNDYSASLPDTITMVKIPGYEHVYESDIFIREINLTNKVRLKLAVHRADKFNYSFYDQGIEFEPPEYKYLVGSGMQFVNRQNFVFLFYSSYNMNYDGELELTEPATILGGYTKIMLFFMAGTPYTESFYPSTSTAYATAVYYIEV